MPKAKPVQVHITNMPGQYGLLKNVFLIFLVLKLCGAIAWPWWGVLAPYLAIGAIEFLRWLLGQLAKDGDE